MKEKDTDMIIDEIEERIHKEEGRRFSERALKEARDPRNIGRIEDPDSRASVTGPCGDTMEFTLRSKMAR